MGDRFAGAPVFVEGLDASAYGIARSLGRNGVSIFALDGGKTDFLRFSRYCRDCYIFPNDPSQQRTYAEDIIPNEQVLYELMGKWRGDFSEKPVLFATSDWFSRFLCNWQHELSSDFLFHWVSRDIFNTITEKGRIAEFCQSAGVHIPLTRITLPNEDVSCIAQEVHYPCLVKPVHRQTVTFPIPAKAFVAQSAQELESFFVANPQLKGATLVQELIEGGDDQIFQCTVLVKQSGETVHATVRKLHQYPPHYGTMCHGQAEPNDQLVTESMKLVRALGYRGLGSLEFKYRASDNRYYFIEMNTRLPWYNGIFDDAGVNLAYLAYLDLTGKPDRSVMEKTRQRNTAWISYRKYSAWYKQAQRTGETALWSWVCSIFEVRSFAWWNWRDPEPFCAALFFRLRGRLGRVLRAIGLVR